MKHIAVVDDNQDIHLLLRAILKDRYRLSAYHSGAAVLAALETERPDLILMDVFMPGMDGVDVVRRIRSNDALRTLPVLALTGDARSGSHDRCLSAGFDSYLYKPIDKEVLLDSIEEHMGAHRALHGRQTSPLALARDRGAVVDAGSWRASRSVSCFGVGICIRTDLPMIALGPYLPPGWVKGARMLHRSYSLTEAGAGAVDLQRNDDWIGTFPSSEEALEQLESDLQIFVAERALGRIFVHAGAVAWRDQMILLPGPSRAGKTTLVTALVRAGATYYSDEYAVLDDRGWVHPYARRLSIREPSASRPLRQTIEQFGGRAGVGPLPVGLVATLRHRPGAHFEPRALSRGAALLSMLSNTVPARRRPSDAVDALTAVVKDALILEGDRGDALPVAQALLRALEER